MEEVHYLQLIDKRGRIKQRAKAAWLRAPARQKRGNVLWRLVINNNLHVRNAARTLGSANR
jgi:hypothetical protein